MDETTEPEGPVFACTDCTWHSAPGEYPEAGACPRCSESVVSCDCEYPQPMSTAGFSLVELDATTGENENRERAEHARVCSLPFGHEGGHWWDEEQEPPRIPKRKGES